jgi:Sulfotransferase domain
MAQIADPMISMAQPNLLLAGFAKCGTTSLAKYLSAHPAILTSAAKEIYYLIDSDSPLASMRGAIDGMRETKAREPGAAKRYADYFPDDDSKRYVLDATPMYFSQARALGYVRDRRDVKIIFMIRDPVERLVSSYRFVCGMFHDYPEISLSGFVDALLDVGNTREAYRSRIRKDFFRYLFDCELDMGRYHVHLTKWVAAAGNGRVFVGTMEELGSAPKLLMRRLCDFLDLDATNYETFEFTPYLQSYGVRLPFLQRLGRRLAGEDLMRYDRMDRHHSQFHRIANERIRKFLDHIYNKLQIRPLHDADTPTLKRLHDFYLPHNLRLRDDFGIDYVRAGARPPSLQLVPGMQPKLSSLRS